MALLEPHVATVERRQKDLQLIKLIRKSEYIFRHILRDFCIPIDLTQQILYEYYKKKNVTDQSIIHNLSHQAELILTMKNIEKKQIHES